MTDAALAPEIQADLDAIGRISSVHSILNILMESTGLGFAAVARVTPDSWTAMAVIDRIGFGMKPGDQLEVSTTFCSEICDSTRPIVIDQASSDPTYQTHRTPKMYGFESYIAVPILLKSGQVFGTICALDPAPKSLSEPKTLRTLELFAELVAAELELDELWRELQRELRHQKLLIGEMNHRVKNTLAVVQTLARQSLKPDRPLRDAREAFESRLQILSAAHSLMSRAGWRSVLVRDLVERTLEPFRDALVERIELDGPDMRVSAQTAVSFSLAIHELATNAAKYGALSVESGRVKVTWWLTRRKGEARLKLQWREMGGPLVTPPAERGFGARLIERGLAAELDGVALMDFRPEGLICSIDAPAPYVAPEPPGAVQPVLFPLP